MIQEDQGSDSASGICVVTTTGGCGINPNLAGNFRTGWSSVSTSDSRRFYISGPFGQVYKALKAKVLPAKYQADSKYISSAYWCVGHTQKEAGAQVIDQLRKKIGALAWAMGSGVSDIGSGLAGIVMGHVGGQLGTIGVAITTLLTNPAWFNIDTLSESIVAKVLPKLSTKGIWAELSWNDPERKSEASKCVQFQQLEDGLIYFGTGDNRLKVTTRVLAELTGLLLVSQAWGKVYKASDLDDETKMSMEATVKTNVEKKIVKEVKEQLAEQLPKADDLDKLLSLLSAVTDVITTAKNRHEMVDSIPQPPSAAEVLEG